MLRKIVLTCLLACGFWSTYAQSFLGWRLRDRYFSFYVGTGWTGYFGDLTNSKPISNRLSHFNTGVEARLYSKISARAQFAYYRIEGSDNNAKEGSFNRQRNLSFQSKNLEWSLQGVYYFYEYNGKYHTRRTYEPYIAIGVGQTFYNPKAKYNGEWYDLRDIGTENNSYKKSTLIVPVSLGVKMSINEFLNLGIDLGYRLTLSKYLDDVAGNYAGPFEAGTIESFLSDRSDQIPVQNEEALRQIGPGNSRGNGQLDSYLFVNFNIEVFLPSDLFKSKKGKKERIIGKPNY